MLQRLTRWSCAIAAAFGALGHASLAGAADPSRQDELVSEWHRLRSLRGHFDGAAWRADVDAWQGAKHRVMQQLAAHLTRSRASAVEVEAAFGAPDARLRAGDPEHAEVAARLRASGAQRDASDASVPQEYWIYDWRGRHDRMALALRDGRLRASGWLYAYE